MVQTGDESADSRSDFCMSGIPLGGFEFGISPKCRPPATKFTQGGPPNPGYSHYSSKAQHNVKTGEGKFGLRSRFNLARRLEDVTFMNKVG